MSVKYSNENYLIKKGEDFFDIANNGIATEQEMADYILAMNRPTISEVGVDLIIEFDPFPEKYVNYIRRKQYAGKRTQVYWQLARYMGRKLYRKSHFFKNENLLTNPRENPNSELYHWTLPTRNRNTIDDIQMYNNWEPFYFTLTPEEASKGVITWIGGSYHIRRFRNRPFGNFDETWPKQIAIIIGLGHKGMKNGYTIYKKSESFYYDNSPALFDLATEIANTSVHLTPVGNDLFVSFSNVSENLKNYAEINKNNNNKAIFIQTFSYRGGSTSGYKTVRGEPKRIRNPVKNDRCRKNLSRLDLENGFFLSEQEFFSPRPGSKDLVLNFLNSTGRFRARYKYDEETFQNLSVALVLANPGMNEGFHTYKESNKINIKN